MDGILVYCYSSREKTDTPISFFLSNKNPVLKDFKSEFENNLKLSAQNYKFSFELNLGITSWFIITNDMQKLPLQDDKQLIIWYEQSKSKLAIH